MFDSYDDWRRTVPWTDTEIVAAIETWAASQPEGYARVRPLGMADHLRRTGRLSTKVLGYALPLLIRHCGLCAKPALYRWGSVGRCREHKHILTEAIIAKRAHIEQARTECERNLAVRDRIQKLRDANRKERVERRRRP